MKYAGEERGSVAMVVTVVMLVVLLLAAVGFGVWAFMGRQDYKNNVDSKIKAAVQDNSKAVRAQDAKEYAEAAKNPLKTYTGPEAYGSVTLQYPRTWSAYVVTGSGQPLDAYFNPDVVPSISDQKSVFALRVQVVATAYSQSVAPYKNLQKQGKVTVSPYALPTVSSVVGVRIDGQIAPTKQGSLVILPVRDKTLKLWIESNQFAADFNNTILPKAGFSP